MIHLEKIYSYMTSLLYPATRHRISTFVSTSISIDDLSTADTEAKLLTLGALLATEKFEEFAVLVHQLDFSDIPTDDRLHLAYCIFTSFSEDILLNSRTSSPLAAAIMQLTTAMAPEIMLTLKTDSGPLKQKTLIEFDYAKKVNSFVNGVVFFREFTFGPGSRRCEFGYRIQSSLASQGWDVSLFPLEEIEKYSSSSQRDFVLIDVPALFQMETLDRVSATLSRLRRFFRKIIILEPDPWTGICDEMLLTISDQVDYIWGFTSDWDLTKESCYERKSILFPNVGGFDNLDHREQINLNWDECTFNFIGSVQGYNLNRTYWILESRRRNLPIEIKITQPGFDDGLDCENSLLLYAQSLAATHASLNLVTRKDGSRIVTSRAIEVISLNRLLIQEGCPAFHHYYADGEHFLEFTDIEGLCVNIEFLRSHPRAAQRICTQGHQFYHERYSNRKLVEHIQTLL